MIEIDIVKASNHQNKPLPTPSYNSSDDTEDISSESDTVLNTPTSSFMMMSDSSCFSPPRRYSYSSSSTTVSSCIKRKPSLSPKSSPPESPLQVELLESKIKALENELTERVKREADLETHVYLLTEKQNKGLPTSQYRSTLSRISKQIDQFLVTQQQGGSINGTTFNKKIKLKNDCWNDSSWIGNEIPYLYGGYCSNNDTDMKEVVDSNSSEEIMTKSTSAIPILLIYRLKSMMYGFTTTMNKEESPVKGFFTELHHTLDSWQEFYNTTLNEEKKCKLREQNRVSRLLEALQKSLLKNKLMKQDHALLIKKYRSDIKDMVNEVNTKITKEEEQIQMQQQQIVEKKKNQQQQDNIQTRIILQNQIQKLERELHDCQDERDEYETTLEMVRKEMETMLEELEDTRQQRVRYKTQASRLRAGLEAIQKRAAAAAKKNNSSSDEDEEDEGIEAIRLLYNEAERQAMDLDRECKRQALTLNSTRQELKMTEEKYHAIKSEKNQELKNLQRMTQKLTRDIEMLQVEKYELVSLQQQLSSPNSKASFSSSSSSTTTGGADTDDEHQQQQQQAKIYALQIALKAAKSDAIIQRTKMSQLERQSTLTEFNQTFVAGLQDLFQKELKAASSTKQEGNLKEMAKIIELEQKIWKLESLKSFQKKYDVDLLRVNRELRFLSCKLNDVEDETVVLKARHLEEISLLQYQTNAEGQKRLQQQASKYRLKEQELQDQLEILYQKNQTLQDESLILYGRNMLMAQKLGKLAL